MSFRLWSCVLALSFYSLLTNTCLAQKIPVLMEAPDVVNNNSTALRFSSSLADQIQLSGKFYLWTGKESELPRIGVRLLLRAVPVKMDDGSDIGSAIFVEADHLSAKDPGYYKSVAEQMWMIPKDDSVADDTLKFLADLDRALH